MNLLEAMPRWTVQADLFTYSTALSSSDPSGWRSALQFSMTMGSWRVVDGIAVNSPLVHQWHHGCKVKILNFERVVVGNRLPDNG